MNLYKGGSLKMKKSSGFTLIELMIVIAILGILSASSVRLYGTYRQRATGTEARIMVKQILEAEIAYFLEHETFFPAVGRNSPAISINPESCSVRVSSYIPGLFTAPLIPTTFPIGGTSIISPDEN